MLQHSATKTKETKKASSFQDGYRKCGTRARMFSQTLANGGTARMKETKKASSFQDGYRKCGTRARMFSQTLANGGTARMKEDNYSVVFDCRSFGPSKKHFTSRKQVLFRMALGNVQLMHECFLKHSRALEQQG